MISSIAGLPDRRYSVRWNSASALQGVEDGGAGDAGGVCLRCEARGEAIDGFAKLIQLHDTERLERHDTKTFGTGFLDEALTLQQVQRVADGLARDVEAVGKLCLADALAGRERAVCDRLQQLLVAWSYLCHVAEITLYRLRRQLSAP